MHDKWESARVALSRAPVVRRIFAHVTPLGVRALRAVVLPRAHARACAYAVAQMRAGGQTEGRSRLLRLPLRCGIAAGDAAGIAYLAFEVHNLRVLLLRLAGRRYGRDGPAAHSVRRRHSGTHSSSKELSINHRALTPLTIVTAARLCRTATKQELPPTQSSHARAIADPRAWTSATDTMPVHARRALRRRLSRPAPSHAPQYSRTEGTAAFVAIQLRVLQHACAISSSCCSRSSAENPDLSCTALANSAN
jgi:hypothetical protein